MNKLGIYIHIPFCLRKCYYCDFHSYSGLEYLYSDYVNALCLEMAGRKKEFSGICVDTVYIGGGTPNLLPTRLLEKIINSLKDCFCVDVNAEITIEANPGIKNFSNRENLRYLKALGINRLSFGVQSFDDKILAAIGRAHTASEGIEAVKEAFNAGFDNVNIDLMYGLAGQSVEIFERSLSIAVQLGINHISVYGLKVEEGTPLSGMLANGCLDLPDETTEAKMYDFTVDYLAKVSYSRYEISNYAKDGYICRHNLRYWEYLSYLGFGVAAHSFARGKRSANTVSVTDYLQRINSKIPPVQMYDEVSSQDKMAEFIFLALRTSQGLYYERFNNYFQTDFLKKYQQVVKKLVAKGLLAETESRIFLTGLGMKFGNQAFLEFLPE